jgi:hypothetical protein
MRLIGLNRVRCVKQEQWRFMSVVCDNDILFDLDLGKLNMHKNASKWWKDLCNTEKTVKS